MGFLQIQWKSEVQKYLEREFGCGGAQCQRVTAYRMAPEVQPKA
jgi:hypothetical protein